MYKFPVTYFEDNLIFDLNNDCWAVFKLVSYNYDYVSTERKISILNSLARFIANLGEEAKILCIPVIQDVSMHFKYLISKMDSKDDLYDVAKAHAEGTKEYIQDRIAANSNANDYVTYVLVKLKLKDNIVRNLKDAFSYVVKEQWQGIMEILSVDTKDILERKIRQFKNLSDDFMRTQKKRMDLEKARAEDIQWLISRIFYRGLDSEEIRIRYNFNEDGEKVPWTPNVEYVKSKGEPAIRPYSKDILTLTSGIVDIKEPRIVKIHHGEKTSYQSFIAVTHLPDGIEFPGLEWIIMMQDETFPVEICLHINNVEHRQGLKKLDKKRQEIKGQIKHIDKNAEDIPDDLALANEYIDVLEAELKASKAPLSRVSITLCVAADNKKMLDDRCKILKSEFDDINLILERPMADQYKLFMECIPGAGRYMSDYTIPLPPRTLAGGIIGASRFLGDNEGPYIGTVGEIKDENGRIIRAGKSVFLDLLYACLVNRSASAFAWGDLGYGKSFNMNLLFYLSCLYGALGLVIDPKGERTKWLYELQEFAGMISVTTLTSGHEDKGKLDPFLIYKDNPEEAGELALSCLAEIFRLTPQDDEYLVILEAINKVKSLPVRSMSHVAEELENVPESDDFKMAAKKASRRIRLLRDMGMAGLLFGDGTEKGLSFDNKINILQVQNLKLPKSNTPKEDYTQEETLSTALMLPIASFAKKFALSFPGVPKINLMDESWALSTSQQGQALFEYLSRTGRSLYTSTIFIGHSTKDIKTEGIRNALSYKFCFHITDIDEIKRSLEFMDMEVTDDNIARIQNLGNGQCIFKDLNGRVGKLSFDCVFDHLKDAFNSTPKKGVKVS